ncbi:septum formation initiator family protein [Corynebacterium caspium]|uniref:septum formation initiator family protein n=1 Tax=Corynebacterium caspium TaxID=234828 RepID=UPI00036D3C32|nr:septum formation initiator family protein [Corynebacterium caspium]WKD59567.1 Cell division protein FtsB [Corynebacterium caspium DSM 44850]
MAEKQLAAKLNKASVPVADRDSLKNQKKTKSTPRQRTPMGTREILVLVSVTLLILATLATPLRNYYQGGAEMRRVTKALAEKSAQKERLLAEIERYENNEDFLRQEARQRLGVIEAGETAFRIIDPSMEHAPVENTPQNTAGEQPWYQLVWDAVSTPEQLEPLPEGRLPIEPAPNVE